MTDKKADDKANPTILAILFAGILATLVFILITGDYGESEVPEQTTEITFVEVEMVPAPEPELIEEEVVIEEGLCLSLPNNDFEEMQYSAHETIEVSLVVQHSLNSLLATTVERGGHC